MGKAARWLWSFLGKKDKKPAAAAAEVQESSPATKEKKRWSFRRSSASAMSTVKPSSPAPSCAGSYLDDEKHAEAVAVATAAAASARAAAAAVRAAAKSQRMASVVQEMAATRIQCAFRGYLARKALCALRGLVKLQALARGHLVRKQANATLRCMQALVAAQSMVRAQRLAAAAPATAIAASGRRRRPSSQTSSPPSADQEFVKTVEIDYGEPRRMSRSRSSAYSPATATAVADERRRLSAAYYYSGSDRQSHYSPAPSALTEMSPTGCSGHFEDLFSFVTAQSSPQFTSAMSVPDQCYPNYMANTESSRAKSRSQSAPKQRTDGAAAALERQPSRRKAAASIPRATRMQRSSSHVGLAAAGGEQLFPWPSYSMRDSECGSTCSMMTAMSGGGGDCCRRSLAGLQVRS